jgi:hypothetical protein
VAQPETFQDEKNVILQHITATLAYLGDDPDKAEENRNWLVKMIRDMLDTITPSDLTIAEVVALNGLLGPAYSRLLSQPPEGIVRLHVV